MGQARTAAGHAVATAHVADHSLGAAGYAAKAPRLAAQTCDAKTARDGERRWQREQLPGAIRELVVSARQQRPVVG